MDNKTDEWHLLQFCIYIDKLSEVRHKSLNYINMGLGRVKATSATQREKERER